MVIRFNGFFCDSRVKNILEAIFNNVLGALLDVVEIMKTRLQRIRKNDSTINKLKKNIAIGNYESYDVTTIQNVVGVVHVILVVMMCYKS